MAYADSFWYPSGTAGKQNVQEVRINLSLFCFCQGGLIGFPVLQVLKEIDFLFACSRLQQELVNAALRSIIGNNHFRVKRVKYFTQPHFRHLDINWNIKIA